MAMFEVSTLEGYTITIESDLEAPSALAATAKQQGYLVATEVISEIGRDADRHEVAITYHAISAIRLKHHG